MSSGQRKQSEASRFGPHTILDEKPWTRAGWKVGEARLKQIRSIDGTNANRQRISGRAREEDGHARGVNENTPRSESSGLFLPDVPR